MNTSSARPLSLETAAIRRAYAKLICLPPYSPDLNPIEQMFAKVKTLPCKTSTRTIGDNWSTIIC